MANFSRENEGKPTGTDSADITVVTSRIDNVESALVGNLSLNLIDIDGATIDGTTVGAGTPSTGAFTTLHASELTVTSAVSYGGEFSIVGSMTAGSAITTGGALSVASAATFNAGIIGSTTASISTNLDVASTLTFGKALGTWVIDTNVVSSNYQATSDLFVVAHISVGNQQGWAIAGYTDSNAVPTQLITRDSANLRTDGGNTTYVNYGSITFPVKKGDYWRVDEVAINAAAGPFDLVINIIPIGG